MANKHVRILNTSDQEINPATEESIVLLRRILKVIESNSTIDSQQRQKITLDNITTSYDIQPDPDPETGIVPDPITYLVGLDNVTSLGAISAVGGTYPSADFGIDIRWQLMSQARNSYANNIRPCLTWE